MEWKEKLVLQFRTLTINKDIKNIIAKSMQNFVDEINSNLDKHRINDIVATTNRDSYIKITNYKQVRIEYSDSDVEFKLYDKCDSEQSIHIKLSITKDGGMYFIEYVDADKSPRVEPFINENIIDEIFKDLFELNQEKIKIK